MFQSMFSQTSFTDIAIQKSAVDFLVVSAEDQAILDNIPGWQVQNNEDACTVPQSQNLQPVPQPFQQSNSQPPVEQVNLQQPNLQTPQQSNLVPPRPVPQQPVPETIDKLHQQPFIPCEPCDYVKLPITKRTLALKRSLSVSDLSDNTSCTVPFEHLNLQQIKSIVNGPNPVKLVTKENMVNSPSSKKRQNTIDIQTNEQTSSKPNSSIPNEISVHGIANNCTEPSSGQHNNFIMPVVNGQTVLKSCFSNQQLVNTGSVQNGKVVSDPQLLSRTYTVENRTVDNIVHQLGDTEPFTYVMGEETQKMCLEMTNNEFFLNSPCTSRLGKSQDNKSVQNDLNALTENPFIVHLSTKNNENSQEEEEENMLSSSRELFPLEQNLKVPKRPDVMRVKRRLHFAEEVPNIDSHNAEQVPKTASNSRLSPIIEVIGNKNDYLSPLLFDAAENFPQPRDEVTKPVEKLFNFTSNDVKEMLHVIWDIYS